MNPSLFICYPRALMTGISLPMEMINAANSVDRIKNKHHQGWKSHIVSGYKSLALGELPPFIELTKGLKVIPEFDLKNAPEPKSIFLPPIWGNPEIVIKKSGALIEWLIEQHARGVKICATGTAVCLLAHSGLLDNKQGTTHWYYFEKFQQKYPKVKMQKHHFITLDQGLYCAGSTNALVELTLYFIAHTFGEAVSQVIEQHFNHEVNKNYERPWLDTSHTVHHDETIIEVQQWMQSHSDQNFTLEVLSEIANMSVRNFSRRFRDAVGKSALTYAIDLKMQIARELLKETNLTHQDICDRIGLKDNAYFSRLFKEKNDLTPTAYRKMVRGKLFAL